MMHNSTKVLSKYFIKHLFRRVESYILSSSSLMIFSLFLINKLRSAERDMFIISGNIYEESIYAAVLAVCVFSSLLAIIHVSRDIDSRIYESYLYGPVDEGSYMISVFISYGLVNLVSVVLLPLLWMGFVFLLTGIAPPLAAPLELIYGFFLANLGLMGALCIGAAARKSKTALWYLLVLHCLLIGIVLGNTIISRYLIPLKKSDVDLFSFFRNLSQRIYDASSWFSPYTQFYLFQKNLNYAPLFSLCLFLLLALETVLLGFLSRHLFKRSVA